MRTFPLNVVITVATVIVALFGLFTGAIIGNAIDRSKPVCHSKTEDSPITDCNYSNGAWYRK